MTPFEINPGHDPEALSRTLAERGRLQISGFVSDDTAQHLHNLLRVHEQWYLTYNEGPENYESSAAQFKALSPQQQHQFMGNLYRRAGREFQYVFWQYYISQAVKSGEDTGHPMHDVNTWVTSDPFLDFMRTLTGRDDVRTSDSYASWYAPGHFLTEHDDRHPTHDRVAAWVLSMTPEWSPNWGGHLAFYDAHGNVEEAFKPSFNTLNIFLIPTPHAVQMVAPFAGKPRTSYLGWLLR